MSEDEFRRQFPAYVEIPVQWGEQDGFGHVNNAVFVRWLEAARIRMVTLAGVELTHQGMGPILAAVSCNFRSQVTFPDTIISGARVHRVGRSSVDIRHAVWSKQQARVVADGDSTVVMFDYCAQASAPISAELRRTLESLGSPH
jgi:acyl-CoA thioester hydrolase